MPLDGPVRRVWRRSRWRGGRRGGIGDPVSGGDFFFFPFSFCRSPFPLSSHVVSSSPTEHGLALGPQVGCELYRGCDEVRDACARSEEGGGGRNGRCRFLRTPRPFPAAFCSSFFFPSRAKTGKGSGQRLVRPASQITPLGSGDNGAPRRRGREKGEKEGIGRGGSEEEREECEREKREGRKEVEVEGSRADGGGAERERKDGDARGERGGGRGQFGYGQLESGKCGMTV